MKMKKKTKIKLILTGLFVIVLGIVIFYFINNKDITFQNNNQPSKPISEIKDYGYTLEKNKSKAFKDKFNKLSDALKEKPIDEEKYVSLVAEMFVLDFYTLDDKITKNDIGGLQFIHTDLKTNFILQVKETIYKYVENNLDGKRKQKLPTVDTVTIKNVEKTAFTYNSNTDPESYKITIEWTYKEDLGYQNKATITLMHEDKKLSIVELN